MEVTQKEFDDILVPTAMWKDLKTSLASVMMNSKEYREQICKLQTAFKKAINLENGFFKSHQMTKGMPQPCTVTKLTLLVFQMISDR